MAGEPRTKKKRGLKDVVRPAKKRAKSSTKGPPTKGDPGGGNRAGLEKGKKNGPLGVGKKSRITRE